MAHAEGINVAGFERVGQQGRGHSLSGDILRGVETEGSGPVMEQLGMHLEGGGHANAQRVVLQGLANDVSVGDDERRGDREAAAMADGHHPFFAAGTLRVDQNNAYDTARGRFDIAGFRCGWKGDR